MNSGTHEQHIPETNTPTERLDNAAAVAVLKLIQCPSFDMKPTAEV